MRSLDGVELESRQVLLRTDLNMPVEDGEPQKTLRFKRYMETIEELTERGARTLVVAHQGRPSRRDFLSLERHAEMVSEELGQEVEFVRSFFGTGLGDAVASMEDGDLVVMENVRFLSEELQNMPPERHAEDFFVRNLAPYFDIYIDDAFSTAHRSHGSIVGFSEHLECYSGRIMERELRSCKRVRDEIESPLLVLGGEKPSDIVGMLERMVDRATGVLLGGIPGELALIAEGYDLGGKSEWIEEQGLDSERRELERLIERNREKFILPDDLRTEEGVRDPGEVPGGELTWDIGPETAERFAERISDSDAVLMKGPMGAFEDHPEGTRAVVEAIAGNEGFTVLGGGHTSSLVQRFDRTVEEFSHVSIAGGAFVRLMSGEELPGVKALEN